MSNPRPAGRPAGSKTTKNTADAFPSRCPACDSTERTPYTNTLEQPYAGIDAAGNPYTHIIRRNTRCEACGAPRIDRTFENRATTTAEPEQTTETDAAAA